ncbi:methionyl-tRNA formyltransferase [Rubrobacter calidifluminis]|uniref:methionyl-tRNA formyltransferase n=1 Tax=Rubrobacter calidifluminis TaxID=1392640 RepID=UPI00235E8585|nr:methionyl-tRNA formyltransferase [Rubrobacter calidifluminis]
MKVAFAGTPEFAVHILEGLLGSGHEVGLVVSQPPRRRGRGRKFSQTPVGKLAASRNLDLVQPEDIGEVTDRIASSSDVLVVSAYGQILRREVLEAARHGAYNVHPSLLPAYRGAAPVERAIMNGEKVTGVSIMKMDERLDTGPVALRQEVEIGPETTGGELSGRLARIGADLLVRVLDDLEAGRLHLEEQDHSRATYAAKISPEERFIRWEDPARRVHDHVRALSPHIGARTTHPDVEGPVKVWRTRIARDVAGLGPGEILAQKERLLVGCGEGALEILELQLPGGRPLSAGEFLRGHRLSGAFGG